VIEIGGPEEASSTARGQHALVVRDEEASQPAGQFGLGGQSVTRGQAGLGDELDDLFRDAFIADAAKHT
jgi:hypothetical protein